MEGDDHGGGGGMGSTWLGPAWLRPGGLNRTGHSHGIRGGGIGTPVTPAPVSRSLGSFSETATGTVEQAMGVLQVSEQFPPSSYPNKGVRNFPVKRPDKGGTHTIHYSNLCVNHFPVKFNPDSIIMHYIVEVRPEVPPKYGRPVKISKSMLSMIRYKLSSDDPTHFPLSMTAYDGERNLFSAVPLPTRKLKVEITEAEDMKNFSYVFSLKLVNELKLCKLKEYLSGNILSVPRDILQGLDLVVKENPTRCMISAGRSFHPTKSDAEDDLGRGITMSRGFQYRLKPTTQGVALCLDYSVLAFLKQIPVIDFLKEHIYGFNLNDFIRFRSQVENALKGLKVTVTHRVSKQKYTIAQLTHENTRYISFTAVDPVGKIPPREVSLVHFFKEKFGMDIKYKDIPCLDLGKNKRKNLVPMEFCVLAEGQRYPKEHLDNYASRLFRDMSLAPPKVRENKICEMIQSGDGPCSGDITNNFDIEVDTNMTRVKGRVIEPPLLKLRAPNGRITMITVDKETCQWNLVRRSVVEGKPILCWAVLDFSSSDRSRLNYNQFIPKLINGCVNLGIHIEKPLLYEATTMDKFSNLEVLGKLLESVSSRAYEIGKGPLQILVCVMAKKHHGYKYLKWISETKVGVVTQCCLYRHANKGDENFFVNLALKINAKLGGSNVELVNRLPHFEGGGHVMFVGADVNHPGSRNTTCPSIAAVVASVNWPAANQYAARVRAQDHRTEKILSFSDMCLELVESYARFNNVKPEKIVVFRDGVSEGQFDMVLNEELIDLKKAFQRKNYYPTITLIVAQKRHQTRLFPESSEDGSSTGNVCPGTVVDTTIVHPFEFDFYLCSHYGSLGTSIPTHYYVLWDEHRFPSDQLQKLIYNMCFTSALSTKPVSLIPPVYYADLVAYRGRLYYEAVMRRQSHASSSSSSSSRSSASSFDDKFFKLHPDLENIMFFV